ncbi:hypothetical protein [Ochrovirga pacifica]|uniref:hypothetical protein n=1 Tax=Ochrovirga pacifica TaxID=1042376 RepID=UPI00025591FE|nr:hypothetical protein [Ochrovirga pacifica]
MLKQQIIAFIFAICSVLFLTDFNVFGTLYMVPNCIWLVHLYFFFIGSIIYFQKVFRPISVVLLRIFMMLSHFIAIGLILYLGFYIWKINNGNIFTETPQEFQINLKNIWFWVVYQSYLLLFFFSAFKQLVTIK